ncbi:sodium- and chloride-dependent glycine transporter 1-like isoform X1 [Varroa destructor]|uniref:Transporter n=2 Tax=Varroa destructor TaxID=109461 RepID=A0A7M7JI06_VARDE|nr:sodium- and chloride-dependent glycine transporter 1-like isoform X1 [Varroa destructor]
MNNIVSGKRDSSAYVNESFSIDEEDNHKLAARRLHGGSDSRRKSREARGGSAKSEDVASTESDQNEAMTADKDSGSNNKSEPKVLSRGQWANKAEFILSCIGLSVGIGNIWRFPFLAYQNGGGAFLLPYFTLMLLIGKPLYYLELAMGQFSSCGCLEVWKCVPAFKGVGYAQLVTSTIISIYYNVVLCYTIFYMGQSFRSELPWSSCAKWWGADSQCYVRQDDVARCDAQKNRLVQMFGNNTPASSGFTITDSRNQSVTIPVSLFAASMQNCTNATETASQQFWNKYVLGLTESIENMGAVRWDLALCLAICWVIVFLCLIKGVKSSGKVVYFTATFPYVVLITLLIRGLTLPGASNGIFYFLVPDWSKVIDIQIWRKAAEQLFYSLGVAQGAIVMFGSYNRFRNPVHIDALFISTMDFLTSLMGGIVIFSILGNMSHELGIPISDVASQGQGLAFVAYPEALSRLVWPQLWSFLFFFMLFLLGLDSEFAMIETLLTALYDERPELRKNKMPLTFLVCFICFILGIPCVMEGGQYVLNLMDTYGGGISVVFLAVSEVIGVSWVYGVNRICADFEFMIGHKQSMYWRISWFIFSPLILMFLFIYGVIKHKPIDYNGVPYPRWADNVGWAMALVSMCLVPIYILYSVFKNRDDFRVAFQADKDWCPKDTNERRAYQEMLNEHRSPSVEFASRN